MRRYRYFEKAYLFVLIVCLASGCSSVTKNSSADFHFAGYALFAQRHRGRDGSIGRIVGHGSGWVFWNCAGLADWITRGGDGGTRIFLASCGRDSAGELYGEFNRCCVHVDACVHGSVWNAKPYSVGRPHGYRGRNPTATTSSTTTSTSSSSTSDGWGRYHYVSRGCGAHGTQFKRNDPDPKQRYSGEVRIAAHARGRWQSGCAAA